MPNCILGRDLIDFVVEVSITMLTGLGAFIAIVAGLFSMVYSIQILILNFQENILWGLASLFLGFPMWVFVALRWDKAGSPFLKSLWLRLSLAWVLG